MPSDLRHGEEGSGGAGARLEPRMVLMQSARFAAAQNSNRSTIIGSFFAAATHSCIAGSVMIASQ